MKKTGSVCRFLCFIFAFLLVVAPVGANAASVDDVSVSQGCHSIDAQIPMLETSEKITNVYSAFLYDYTNDILLYAVNPDQQYDPASLVKIMTGLLIAERGNMDDQVTVSESFLATLSSNSLNFQAGEVISMQDLLYCVLVESSNDAAALAATHISGSQEAFVAEMNRYASELGCKDTVFTNVHGVYDELQVSTARDLARVLAKAAKNETFMEAFSTVKYTVPATNMSEARELSSGNYMMNDDLMTVYLDSRVTGGRTGIMETGERNLAVTAERNDLKLVSVVLGSISELAANGHSVVTFGSFNETSALLDLGFSGHHSVQLFYENQALKQYAVTNGDSYVSAGVKDAVLALLPYGITHDDLSFRYNEDTTTIYAPVTAGDQVATVEVWYNDLCLAQTDLYALHDVKVQEVVETEELADNSGTSSFTVLIVIAVIVGLLVLLLFGRRVILQMIRRHQIRRHRKNRRRSR